MCCFWSGPQLGRPGLCTRQRCWSLWCSLCKVQDSVTLDAGSFLNLALGRQDQTCAPFSAAPRSWPRPTPAAQRKAPKALQRTRVGKGLHEREVGICPEAQRTSVSLPELLVFSTLITVMRGALHSYSSYSLSSWGACTRYVLYTYTL